MLIFVVNFDLYCFNGRVFVLDQRMAFSGHVTFDIVLPTIFASQSALNFPLIDLLVWLSFVSGLLKRVIVPIPNIFVEMMIFKQIHVYVFKL